MPGSEPTHTISETKPPTGAEAIIKPNLIHSDSVGIDEASRLEGLAVGVKDQDDLERDIGRQADQLLADKAVEQEQKRLEKTSAEKEKLQGQIRKLVERRSRPDGPAVGLKTQAEIVRLEDSIKELDVDLQQIQERIDQRLKHENDNDVKISNEESSQHRMPNETQRDFLIRTGKITPFSKIAGRTLDRSDTSLKGLLYSAEEDDTTIIQSEIEHSPIPETLSHRNLLQPGFADAETDEDKDEQLSIQERPPKRRRLAQRRISTPTRVPPASASCKGIIHRENEVDPRSTVIDAESQTSDAPSANLSNDSEDEYLDLSDARSLASDGVSPKHKLAPNHEDEFTGLDDGNEKLYQKRLDSWIARRSEARSRRARKDLSSNPMPVVQSAEASPPSLRGAGTEETEEWYMPHPTEQDASFEDGFKIPGDIYPSLFGYQKVGVQWLWELYSQSVGGIVGDEMGLGKTIQVIAFLAGLHYSKKIAKPILIVAPATVMKQWVNEFHKWWPPFRVSILHTSGSGMVDVSKEAREEDIALSRLPTSNRSKPPTKAHRSAQRIVNRVAQDGHILVTTYSGLQSYADLLIPMEWEYCVLDEGHKIRNPNTAITIYSKELRTANRIILSGTPMQNNLQELWSLFDFVFPMRLGTLVNFRNQFEFPIRQGGYANATNLQVQTALKCAETLKDTISPYLLQRFKADVAADLPKKSEQVLFCKLTKYQRDAYESFIGSDELKGIMAGKRQVLYGVDILRKICNHPDLQEHRSLSKKPGYNYGAGSKSGKMQVVKELLKLWREQGHKTLLFAQHRIMLDILEKDVRSVGGFNYRRMDGTTPISHRQGLVDEFNNNPNAHVFLLTTKVGGLGINLTGADRVIIYDPDWNPSTDVQARERAWRLGQKREVMIYRLMTAGTIEEKIYHRQLFKQFLINKILRDPKQRQTFKLQDLHDLFTLGSADETTTETADLFQGTEVQFGGTDETGLPIGNDPSLHAGSKPPGPTESSSVRDLRGVASMEKFAGAEEEESAAAAPGAANSEARVMESIFARSGVHAALEHDQIVNGKKVITADPQIIEKEAKRVAAEAAKELKKAGEAARQVPIGTPTWTGQFGTAGRPEQQQRGFGRGRGGPSSSAILAGLQNRQNLSEIENSCGSNSTRTAAGGVKGGDFITMIRDFLVTHGGSVVTQMLVDQFNRYCTTPQKSAEFSAILKEIATKDNGSRGRVRWVLKKEYDTRRP